MYAKGSFWSHSYTFCATRNYVVETYRLATCCQLVSINAFPELKVCLCVQARVHMNGQLEKEYVTPMESHSLGAILPNNCLRACLSLRSPYPAVTSLGDSHPMATRRSYGSVRNKTWHGYVAFFSLPCYCFHTLVSTLQHFPLVPLIRDMMMVRTLSTVTHVDVSIQWQWGV